MDNLIRDMIKSVYKRSRLRVQHCDELTYILAEMEVVQYANSICTRDSQTFLRNERFLQEACDCVEKQLLHLEERLCHTAKGRCQCYMVRRNLSIFKVKSINEPKHNISGRILATEKFLRHYNLYHNACRDTIQVDPSHQCNSCSIIEYQDEEDGVFFKKRSSSARHPRGSLELYLKHKTYYYLLESDNFYCVVKSINEFEKDAQPGTSKEEGYCRFEPYRSNLFGEIRESKPSLEDQLRHTALRTQVISLPGAAGVGTLTEEVLAARAAADRHQKLERVENWLQGIDFGQQMNPADSDEGGSTYSDAIGQLMADDDVLVAGITEEDLQDAAKYVKHHRDHQDNH